MLEADKDDKVQANTGRSSVAKNVFPNDPPTVRIIFHGLQCFYFDGTNPCEVGLHNKTHGLGRIHKHQHDLSIAAWTTSLLGECIPLRRPTNLGSPQNVGDIDISVHEATDFLDGVYVYEKDPFNRADEVNSHPRDWRWVIDFERDVYTVPVGPKNGDSVRPSIRINNGLFYTFHRTASKFYLHPADNSGDKPLGRVAQVIAANIYLKPLEGRVDLKIGSLPAIPLPALPSVTYQIDIMNHCNRDVSPACVFDRDSPHDHNRHLPKDERNDFYLYYDTFQKPAKTPEYELVRSERYTPEGDELEELCSEGKTKKEIVSTDEAPCGGSTFGQSRKPDGG